MTATPTDLAGAGDGPHDSDGSSPAPATAPDVTGEALPPAPGQPGWSRADTVRTAISTVLAAALLATAWWLRSINGDGLGGQYAPYGLLAGLALGILFERGRFCFYCIFRDAFEARNTRGVYAILTAIAVGSLGYVFVFSIRVADPTSSGLPSSAHIGPVSWALVLAGLVFGLGIVISGGCIAGHLYRLGEGSLRSLPALAGAVVGFGLGFLSWNPLYSGVIEGSPAPWLPAGGGYGVALALQLGVLVTIGVWLLRWNPPTEARERRAVTGAEIWRRVFAERWPALATGAGVGLVGVFAYLRGMPLGVTSQLSSVARTGAEAVDLLPHTLRGLDANLRGCVAAVVETITANGWLIIGIVLGSLIAALPGRRVGIERLSLRGAGTGFVGGILLGWGAIIGLGCTVGVFLSGTQALAVSGWVFAAAVVVALGAGFRLGLHRGT